MKKKALAQILSLQLVLFNMLLDQNKASSDNKLRFYNRKISFSWRDDILNLHSTLNVQPNVQVVSPPTKELCCDVTMYADLLNPHLHTTHR